MAVRNLRLEIAKRNRDEAGRWLVTLSTDNPVRRIDDEGQEYLEVLSHDPGAVDLSRAPLPLLEVHDSSRLNIGLIEDLHLEGSRLRGWLVLGSSTRARELAPDIEAGIVSGLSVGYEVLEWRKARTDAGLVKTAIRWTPFEGSLTGVPADIAAGIGRTRSAMPQEENAEQRSESAQPAAESTSPKATTKTTTKTTTPKSSTVLTQQREIECEDLDPEEDAELYEEMGCGEYQAEASEGRDKASEGQEAERSKGDCGCANRGKRIVTLDQARTEERRRCLEIRSLVKIADLPEDFGERLIERGASIALAAAKIRKEREKRDMPVHESRRSTGVTAGLDQRDHFRTGATNALADKLGLGKLEASGRRYRHMSAVDLCKASLLAAGARLDEVESWTRQDIASAALGRSDLLGRAGMHSTSDLPYIFGDIAGQSLRKAYDEAPPTWRPFTRIVTLPDFKDRKLVQFSEGPTLLQVAQGGPYKHGTVSDSRIVWHLLKYGRIFAVTWESMLADEMDALSRIPAMFGSQARQKESDLVWAQLTGNPTMAYDSTALFHANHGNYDSSGAALANDKLAAGRAKVRLQKGLDGVTPLNLMPKFLMVPAALEFTAMQLLAPVSATQASNVNLFAGQFQLIVEPRLDVADNDAWYLSCDPSQNDTIEAGYLEGEGQGPTITTRDGFDTDGMEIRARLVFGTQVIDHRSFYKSAGA